MNEIWKPFPLNEKYLVSNLGKVKGRGGKLLSQCPAHGGYLTLTLFKNGQKTTWTVQRIIMLTFDYRENYKELQVDHINGVRTDNRLENLRWIGQSENIQTKLEKRQALDKEITRIVNKYGYEKTFEILQKID